jgi:hypothetical protein
MRIKFKIINKFKILIKGWTWKQLKVHKKLQDIDWHDEKKLLPLHNMSCST